VGHANATVNVGNNGSVQQITGLLTISDPPATARASVNVDDSADPTPRTPTLDTLFVGLDSYGRITGLAPTAIEYHYGDVDNVTVQTGTGGSTVAVLTTSPPVNLIGHGTDTFNIGSAGSVHTIMGALTITDPPQDAYATVNVDDSADGVARNVTLDTSNGFGRITGLGSAPISYKYEDTNKATLQTGIGGATVNVLATGVPVTLTGHGSSTVYVGLGGTIDQIQGTLSVNGLAGVTILGVYDQNGAPGLTYSLSANELDRDGAAPILYNGIQGLTVYTADASIFHAISTAAGTPVFVSDAGSMQLLASDGDNTWNITGQNAGTLSSQIIAGTLTFSGASYLRGGFGNDTFVFADGAGVDVGVDGEAGVNTLDYSAYSSSVMVDLQTGLATGVGGGVANIENVIGGNGGGDSGNYNLLIGNGGNVLTGGFGRRNILVAGTSASTLNGGDQDDLLIAGTTAYDTDPALASWSQIAAEWAGPDDFWTRITKLSTGNGVPLLDPTTVIGNGGGNTLIGNREMAWIFTDGFDAITNFDPNSPPVVTINP
jgi:hypothetical protein